MGLQSQMVRQSKHAALPALPARRRCTHSIPWQLVFFASLDHFRNFECNRELRTFPHYPASSQSCTGMFTRRCVPAGAVALGNLEIEVQSIENVMTNSCLYQGTAMCLKPICRRPLINSGQSRIPLMAPRQLRGVDRRNLPDTTCGTPSHTQHSIRTNAGGDPRRTSFASDSRMSPFLSVFRNQLQEASS